MLELKPERLAEVVQQAFDATLAAPRHKALRWQTAIVKARRILEDSPFWHMDAGTLLLVSPDSSDLYEVTAHACVRVDGARRVACLAYANGQPCKHRATHRLLSRYLETSH